MMAPRYSCSKCGNVIDPNNHTHNRRTGEYWCEECDPDEIGDAMTDTTQAQGAPQPLSDSALEAWRKIAYGTPRRSWHGEDIKRLLATIDDLAKIKARAEAELTQLRDASVRFGPAGFQGEILRLMRVLEGEGDD